MTFNDDYISFKAILPAIMKPGIYYTLSFLARQLEEHNLKIGEPYLRVYLRSMNKTFRCSEMVAPGGGEMFILESKYGFMKDVWMSFTNKRVVMS